MNAVETIKAIEALRPDYIYTLGWSQLFREAFIKTPSRYVVGSHPSELPAGRGRAPVPWTILQGHRQSAVTLFRIDVGVDSGPDSMSKALLDSGSRLRRGSLRLGRHQSMCGVRRPS